MWGLKRLSVFSLCLILVLLSGRSTSLSANSMELSAIYLDFEIALELLKRGYPLLQESLTEAQKQLLGLENNLNSALEENESLKKSLVEQRTLLEFSQKELEKTRQRSIGLENTLTAVKVTADIELRKTVMGLESRVKFWRILAISGAILALVEGAVIVFR